MVMQMKNRKNYLKARKKQFKMSQIGWVINEKCPECEEKAMILIYKHDALACMACNEWKDKACDDPKCPLCSTRPQTPYEVYWNYEAGVNSSLERKQWRRFNYQHKQDGARRHVNKYKWKEK